MYGTVRESPLWLWAVVVILGLLIVNPLPFVVVGPSFFSAPSIFAAFPTVVRPGVFSAFVVRPEVFSAFVVRPSVFSAPSILAAFVVRVAVPRAVVRGLRWAVRAGPLSLGCLLEHLRHTFLDFLVYHLLLAFLHVLLRGAPLTRLCEKIDD